MYIELVVLLTAHLFGDFVFQNNFLAKNKGDNIFIMCVHCYLWSITMFIGFIILNLNVGLLTFLTLFVTHFIIDKWKCSIEDKSKALTFDLYIDQSLHGLMVILIFLMLKGA